MQPPQDDAASPWAVDDSLPLSPFDDFPFHQAIAPIAVAGISDSHFNDGYYFAWYEPGRHFFCGLRRHPNTNVVDGYAGLVDGDEQRSIRITRELRPEVDRLVVGPLRVEIVEPMVRQRVVLDDNASGVAFDVTMSASGPPFLETPRPHYRHGRLFNHVYRYTQTGRVDGTGSLDGEPLEFSNWYGCRDHSWGIRSTMGPHVPIRGSSASADRRAIRLWVPFEVGDRTGFFHTHEDRSGTPLDFEGRLHDGDGGSMELRGVAHELEYHPDSRRLRGGSFTLTDAAGARHRFRLEVVCHPAHPQGFGYTRGWRDGGQPGVYRGRYHEEVDRFPVHDPIAPLGPQHVPADRRLGGTEFACSIEDDDGTTGMAHVEHMIYGSYQPLGSA